MGHKALVAYQRPDGRFNVHFSPNGAHDLELCTEITEDTPLGGDNTEPEFLNTFINALEKNNDVNAAGQATGKQVPTAVAPEPQKISLDMTEVCEYLHSYSHAVEALYVVDGEFNVTGFQCLHIEFKQNYRGAILLSPMRYDGEPVNVRFNNGWFNGASQALTNQLAAGEVSEDEATDRLIRQVLEKIKRETQQQVLAHSPGIPETYYEEYIPAFLKPRGMSQQDGELIVHQFADYNPWELPDDFPNPELAKQSGDKAQFDLNSF